MTTKENAEKLDMEKGCEKYVRKNVDYYGRFRSVNVSFRVSPEESNRYKYRFIFLILMYASFVGCSLQDCTRSLTLRFTYEASHSTQSQFDLSQWGVKKHIRNDEYYIVTEYGETIQIWNRSDKEELVEGEWITVYGNAYGHGDNMTIRAEYIED